MNTLLSPAETQKSATPLQHRQHHCNTGSTTATPVAPVKYLFSLTKKLYWSIISIEKQVVFKYNFAKKEEHYEGAETGTGSET
ncbi:MAG: hypothetical protein IKW01_04310 [Firmicutes bacterium]|nr:hypothetical protein [Bacillota bacterium]